MSPAYQAKFEGMNGTLRVRFAPSPTGLLHIGSARTALFNWLFARAHGGSYILRIEDTDKERSRKDYEQNILESFKWLGLDWDEGPEKQGLYGPYRQSERTALYKKYIEQLLDQDKAYRCFCTKEELEAQSREMESRGEAPRYRGTCSHLPQKQIETNIAGGKPFIIRLRMPNKKLTFEDMIRGKISFDMALTGDIAIAKGEEDPLWIFVVTIDDYEMKISHVIRAEEHLSNTPKQIVLQELLGFPIPFYAHLPMILAPDRAKLSKRHGATSIQEYKDAGYLPEAIINFIALLGWHPSGDKELFTLDELAKEFSIARVQKAGAVFNVKRLDWLNNHYLRKKTPSELAALALPFYEKTETLRRAADETYANSDGSDSFDAAYVEKALALATERAQKLADFPELTGFFFLVPPYEAKLLQWRAMQPEHVREQLSRIMRTLESIDNQSFTQDILAERVSGLYGADRGEILWPLRVALSGKQFSPGPFEIAEILGKDRVLKRIKQAIQKTMQ